MKKQDTNYKLEINGDSVKIFKDGKVQGHTLFGIESALEAIFVLEEMTKDDWLIYEDEKVLMVDRVAFGKGVDCESAS